MLNDFMASLLVVFILAAKSLRKISPKGHKRQEQHQQQPLGTPQRQLQQQHTALLTGLIAIFIAILPTCSRIPSPLPGKIPTAKSPPPTVLLPSTIPGFSRN